MDIIKKVKDAFVKKKDVKSDIKDPKMEALMAEKEKATQGKQTGWQYLTRTSTRTILKMAL